MWLEHVTTKFQFSIILKTVGEDPIWFHFWEIAIKVYSYNVIACYMYFRDLKMRSFWKKNQTTNIKNRPQTPLPSNNPLYLIRPRIRYNEQLPI